jgi:radical SAM protein with 4Fe4S-binding SPASM domain
MSLTLKPILKCNIDCVGCYENSVLGGPTVAPDVPAMLATAARSGSTMAVLHGGEILLLRLEDAEALCAGLKALKKDIKMQTNATILTDGWMALIEKYEIDVGVSLNGPGALNRARRAGPTDETTDRMTERVHRNLERLAKAERLAGVIVVLSTHNAGDDLKLEALIDWAGGYLLDLGVTSIRFNPLFGEGELAPGRLRKVYRRLLQATTADARRQWMPFREWIDNLCGLGLAPCWMKPCDPYHTDAVHAVFGDGSEGNCLRTSPDGTPWQRAETRTYIRQDILFQIPMAEGGCGGCRYWNFCHGGCPAEGFDGDWRNKTRWCDTIQATYQAIEEGLAGWLPNWRPATTWEPKDPAALARSIEDRRPLIHAFGAMDPLAESASTHQNRTVPVD